MTASEDRPYRVALNIDAEPDPQYVLELAEAFAESVRVLNHQTRDHAAFGGPADVHGTITDISLGVSRLPQMLEQAARWLAAEHEAGRVGTDDGADPATAVMAARIRFDQARAVADDFTHALNSATSVTSHLKTANTGEDADG